MRATQPNNQAGCTPLYYARAALRKVEGNEPKPDDAEEDETPEQAAARQPGFDKKHEEWRCKMSAIGGLVEALNPVTNPMVEEGVCSRWSRAASAV